MPLSLSRSIILLFLAEFSFYISGYLVQMGAGRILGPTDYGTYSLVITFTILVANLVGNGIPIAMSKFLSEALRTTPGSIGLIKRKSALAQALFMGIVTLLFLMFAPLFATLLGDKNLSTLFILSATMIPFYSADAFYFYYYSGIQKFALQSSLKLSRSLMRVLIILGLAFLFQLKGLIAGYIFVPLCVFLISLGFDIWDKQKLPIPKNTTFSLSSLFTLALPITAFLILFEVLISFDIYLIKAHFQDDTLAGLYSAALTLARTPSYLFYALTLILLPLVAESSSVQDLKKIRSVVSQALRFMLLLMFPFCALCFAYPISLLQFFFGSRFTEAAVFFPTLVLGTSTLAIIYVLAFAYKGIGRIHIPIFFVLGALLLNTIFDFLFLSLGAFSFSFGKALTGLIILPLFLLTLRSSFGITLEVTAWIKMLFATFIIGGLALLSADTLPHLFLLSPLLLALYFFLLYAFKEITPEDIRLVRSAFRKSKKTSEVH